MKNHTQHHQDIESYKTHQRVLHAMNQWQQALDASPDLVAVLDSHLQIITLNQAACNCFGIQNEEAAGKDYCTLLHQGNAKHPDCPHSKLEKTGTWQTCAHPILIRDRNYMVSISPLLDDEGKIIANVHVAREVA